MSVSPTGLTSGCAGPTSGRRDRAPIRIVSCSSEVEMSPRTMFARRAMIGSFLAFILCGCGAPPEIPAVPSDEGGLKQFGELYRNYTARNKRPPTSLKELAVKGQGYPIAVEQLKSGELVVEWGAPLAPEGDSTTGVLAYAKSVPERGGPVLLRDGWTIKRMTADEFKAAPKAAGR